MRVEMCALKAVQLTLVGDNDIMREVFGEARASSSNEEKLIGLMEEMLKEFKSAKASESTQEQQRKGLEGRAMAADVQSDDSLTSELEELLQELE